MRYALKENNYSKNKEDATLILRHNLRSRSSITGFINEYKLNESYRLYRRKDSVTLFHNILSFAPHDKKCVTDKVLKDIAKKFVELRGENNLYLAVAHKEKAHAHLHIVVSGVQLNGYSSRISKQQFKHIKLELDKFQKEKHPELIHSAIQHEKNIQKSKEEIIELVKSTRQTDKQKLLADLEQTYNKATSTEDFLNKLKAQSYEPYYRNNNLQGVILESRKYRLSRLGYSAQMVEDLNHKISKTNKTLQELQNLRSGRNKELKKELQQVEQKIVAKQDEAEQIILDELATIRDQKESREIDEQELDYLKCGEDIENTSPDESTNDTDEDESPTSIPFATSKPNLLQYEDEEWRY